MNKPKPARIIRPVDEHALPPELGAMLIKTPNIVLVRKSLFDPKNHDLVRQLLNENGPWGGFV